MAEMTERQAKAWPKAVAILNAAVESDAIQESGYSWHFDWADEIRPGRGHDLNAIYNDGEYFAQIMLDVYGSASASVASLNWIHTPNEECNCPACEVERSAE